MPVVALVACLTGLVAASYLTLAHFDAALTLACPSRGVINCATVTTSAESTIAGVPVALIGLIYFAAITPLHLPAAWRSRSVPIRQVRLAAAALGAATVTYLIYTEAFALHAVCLWCSVVHAATLCLLAATLAGTRDTAT